MRPCCDFTGKIKANTVEEYFRSNDLKQVQTQILNNSIPDGCKRCPQREKYGASKRTLSLARQGVSCIQDTITDQIVALDIKPTNKCNMSCLSCSSLDSSLVFVEAKKNDQHMDHYIETFESHKFDKLSNGWTAEFIDSLIDRLHPTATVHITGGEPSIAIDCIRFLQQLVNRRLIDITIKMHSNFLHHSNNFITLLSKFDNLIVRASIDAIDKTAEFIRPGTVWSVVESNIKDFNARFPHAEFSINPAMSILNVWSFKELATWCEANNYKLEAVNLLLWPEYFQINIHSDFKETLLDNISLPNIRSMVEKEYNKELGYRCKTNLEKNDRARSVKYKDSIPELWRMLNVEEKN